MNWGRRGKARAGSERGLRRVARLRLWRNWLLSAVLGLVATSAPAAPLVSTDSPEGFFTNVVARLLSAQLGLDLNHLQVYPTNEYTPAVHRLLQLTANLYEAATSRLYAADYPYLPAVFRPLFRRDSSGAIFIVGYREVTDDTVARFGQPGTPNVVLGVNQSAVPVMTTAFQPDALEPLVVGIPLVIGARKGLPNFNEFAMQTGVLVYRRLQFRRQGTSNTLAIVETNQMYQVSITNTCGVEAWNSYAATYPRNLELRLDGNVVAIVTNEFGMLLVSNAVPLRPPAALVASNAWPGFITPNGQNSAASFKAWLNNFLVLTNVMYSDSLHWFELPADFERGNGFPIPHWFLGLRTMLRFALVDTSVSPARIVDYVSLDSPPALQEITPLLMTGAHCGSVYTPDGGIGSMWCTNRVGSPDSVFSPTYGILNQIQVALGTTSASQWPPSAHQAEVDFFRTQFGLSPLFYPGGTFSLTNVFVCPYSAARQVSLYTSWQANDPLVHYTLADLVDILAGRPSYELDTTFYSPLTEVGGQDFFTGLSVGSTTPLNNHYRPWGGNPLNGGADTTPSSNFRLELKDPHVRWPDDWDFPTNASPDLSWLGQVHRGTPWQTLYLKSSGIDLTTWAKWTGDMQIVTNWDGSGGVAYDAAFTSPSNDWRLAGSLISLLSTNDPRTLFSVNEPALAAWTSALHGLVALTNTASDAQLKPSRGWWGAQFDTVVVLSNSPQAAFMAAAMSTARSNQAGQRFARVGDILATPELSVASPFLNQGTAINLYIHPSVYTYQQTWSLSDAAYEAIPCQLLPRLRPDSLGSIEQNAGLPQVRFSGADGYAYAVQVSPDLMDWTCVSTNYPSNGVFNFQESAPLPGPQRFYRSLLLP